MYLYYYYYIINKCTYIILRSVLYFCRGTKFQNLFFEKHTKKKPQTHKDNYISIIFTDSLHYR